MSNFESEKTPHSHRWSVETSKPIDRAIALVMTTVVLHLLGLDAEIVKAVASLIP